MSGCPSLQGPEPFLQQVEMTHGPWATGGLPFIVMKLPGAASFIGCRQQRNGSSETSRADGGGFLHV